MIPFEKVIAAHIYYINVYRTNHNLDRLFPDFLIVLCANIFKTTTTPQRSLDGHVIVSKSGQP